MSSAFSVQLIAGPPELSEIAQQCDDLARQMHPRLPFSTSNWLALWWRYYAESRPLVRDSFFVHAVRDQRGALLALAPLTLTERPARGLLRSRCVSFFGADKNITELRGLICAPEHQGLAVRALLAHFSQRAEQWDWFVWNGVHPNTEAYRALSEAQHFEWTLETADYVLLLPATWEQFRAGLSRNIKESLRKCYNSLKRNGHAFTFRAVSDPTQLPAALNRFFQLHASRANAPGQTSHADVFHSAQARGLLVDLAHCPSVESRLLVFELEIGGQVVASRVGFVLGNELYLYFSGYDPAWAQYSVMTTTVAESIKWAINRQLRLINLSPGTDASKTRWGATALRTHSGVLLSERRRGRFMFRILDELNERGRPGTWLGNAVECARRLG